MLYLAYDGKNVNSESRIQSFLPFVNNSNYNSYRKLEYIDVNKISNLNNVIQKKLTTHDFDLFCIDWLAILTFSYFSNKTIWLNHNVYEEYEKMHIKKQYACSNINYTLLQNAINLSKEIIVTKYYLKELLNLEHTKYIKYVKSPSISITTGNKINIILVDGIDPKSTLAKDIKLLADKKINLIKNNILLKFIDTDQNNYFDKYLFNHNFNVIAYVKYKLDYEKHNKILLDICENFIPIISFYNLKNIQNLDSIIETNETKQLIFHLKKLCSDEYRSIIVERAKNLPIIK